MKGPGGINYLDMMPDFTNRWDIAVAIFIMPIAVQWWAVWYPGAEPGGGSFIAQRMLASKSEKDSLGSVLFFNLAHYVLRPWPWILVGLCSLIVFPELSDIQKAFPNLNPKLLGHDIAYPAMLTFLPHRLDGPDGCRNDRGQFVDDPHASQLGRFLPRARLLRRFIARNADEKHYVLVGRLATIGLFLCSGALTFVLDSAKANFNIMLQVGAGTGLLYLVRWFWWRVNAWSEVAAMVSSFGFSIVLLVLKKNGLELSTHVELLLTIAFTTVCWLLTAFFGPPTDQQTLIAFYKKVRPFGPGWKHIREAAGISIEEARSTGESIPLAIAGWVSGCVVIWSALFAVGNYLYGQMTNTVVLLIVFVASGAALLRVINRLWAGHPSPSSD